MRLVRTLCLLALALATAGPAAAAPAPQSAPSPKAPSATLRGQVLDPSGAAVAHAQVTLIAATGLTRQAATDAQGGFILPQLPPGTAQLVVTAAGFAPFQRTVPVGGASAPPLAIHLKLSTSQQVVSVSAQAAQVNLQPADRAAAVTLAGRALQSLSDDPDQLQTDLAALAGPSVGDAGGAVYIDGFTRGDIPPKSAISSIQVNNNPFSARFNRLGYGRIEIETKPGSQSLHGQLEYDGNSSPFNALNPFLAATGTPPPPYHSNIFSADVGGPLGKSISWFLAVERRDINNLSVVNAQVLSPTLAPQPFVATLANPNRRTAITPRFDLQLTPSNVLTARYEDLQWSQIANGVGGLALPSQAFDRSSHRHNLQVGDTQLLGPSTVNRLRFQFLDFHDNNAAEGSGPTLRVLGAFIGGGNNNGTFQRHEMHNDLRDDLALTRGAHQLELGGEANDVNRTESDTSNYNGTFVFPSLNVYQATLAGLQQGLTMPQLLAAGDGPSQFTLTAGAPSAHINRLDAAVYLQDAWQLRPNLVANYGLRLETENMVHDHADWAPRLGLAWGLGRGPSPPTVLRAGLGMFYRRLDDDQMIVVAHLSGLNQRQYSVPAPSFYPSVPDAATLAALASASPTTYSYSPSLQAPDTLTASVSLERQLGHNGSLSLSFLHSRGQHQFFTNDINAPLAGTYNPALSASAIRPFGAAAGNIYQYQSAGIFRQNQLTLNFKLHPSDGLSLSGYYSFNDAHSDSAGADSFPSNPFNLLADYGRAPYGVRHRVFLSGNFNLPWGFAASPFLVAQSGQPFSLVLGEDLFGTGQQNARPSFATASTPLADVLTTPFGAFNLHPSPTDAMIPPNTQVGPAAFAINLRLTRIFNLGGAAPGSGANQDARYQLSLGVEARNLLNRVNLAPPVGNLNSPLFGQSIGLMGGEYSAGAANRRVDLLATFSF